MNMETVMRYTWAVLGGAVACWVSWGCTKKVVFSPDVTSGQPQSAPLETRFRICGFPDDGNLQHRELRAAVCGDPARRDPASTQDAEYDRAAALIGRLAMPPGSVVAYAGADVPVGWLVCDGSPVSRTEYPQLFAAIGLRYGNGGGQPGMFTLPDYQGRFLRGVSGASGTDPDANQRDAPWVGGERGNVVGSTQPDALQNHHHGLETAQYEKGPNGNTLYRREPGGNGAVIDSGGASGATIAAETRPRNVSVMWLIRY